MRVLVKIFVEFLEKEVIFSKSKEMKFLFKMDKKNFNKFVICILEKKKWDEGIQNSLHLLQIAEVVLIMKFEEKEMYERNRKAYRLKSVFKT